MSAHHLLPRFNAWTLTYYILTACSGGLAGDGVDKKEGRRPTGTGGKDKMEEEHKVQDIACMMEFLPGGLIPGSWVYTWN